MKYVKMLPKGLLPGLTDPHLLPLPTVGANSKLERPNIDRRIYDPALTYGGNEKGISQDLFKKDWRTRSTEEYLDAERYTLWDLSTVTPVIVSPGPIPSFVIPDTF